MSSPKHKTESLTFYGTYKTKRGRRVRAKYKGNKRNEKEEFLLPEVLYSFLRNKNFSWHPQGILQFQQKNTSLLLQEIQLVLPLLFESQNPEKCYRYRKNNLHFEKPIFCVHYIKFFLMFTQIWSFIKIAYYCQ